MKFILFDREENYIGNLKYVLVANHYEEINGEDILEFTTLDSKMEKGYRIAYKNIYGIWHEFIIRGIEKEKKDDGVIKYVYCESSFYETFGDYIDDKRPSGQASLGMLAALEPTRWEVGIVDNLGESRTNFYRISAKESVHKVAAAWKGEIRTRVIVSGNKITRRYVDLLARRGNDLGKRFTYTKDIESVKKTIHREDVITALYGYGKGEEIEDTGGYGRRIDFADINNGKAYVENNDARLIWGRNNPDGTRSHVFSKVEFDECEDRHELLLLTLEKLEEISSPLVSYEAKVINLKAYGFEHEGVELGDTVAIIDKDFEPELRLKARVVGVNRDLLEPSNNEIILGNFIPSIIDSTLEDKSFIDNFRNKQGIWDRSNVINQDGSINANILNDLVNELNLRMNSQGGYVYISDDGKGLTTYDKPVDQDPTMAIQILGGAFRIAGSKLPNGEWDWRTFGTGEGFVADLITTGTLNASLIKAGVLSNPDNTFWIDMIKGDYNFKDKIKFIDGVFSIDLNSEDLVGLLGDVKVGSVNLVSNLPQNWEEGGFNNLGQPTSKNNYMRTTDYYPHDSGNIVISFLKDLGYEVTVYLYDRNFVNYDKLTISSEDAKGIFRNINVGFFKVEVTKVGKTWGELLSWNWGEVKEKKWNFFTKKVVIGTLKLKIENGDIATAWTPSPHDTEENLNIKINDAKAEIKVTTDAISSRVESTETNVATLDTRMNSAEQKITPEAITSTVEERTTTLATKSEVKQTADNVILSFQDLQNLHGEDVVIESGNIKLSKDGIKVTHSGAGGQYSEMRADGFVRKWQYGEAKYLNDIYTYSRSASPTFYDRIPPLVVIRLPEQFRGRRVDVSLSLRNAYIDPVGFDRYGEVRSVENMIDFVLDVYRTNMDLTRPEIEVDAYTEFWSEGYDGYRERGYRTLGFTLTVVGS